MIKFQLLLFLLHSHQQHKWTTNSYCLTISERTIPPIVTRELGMIWFKPIQYNGCFNYASNIKVTLVQISTRRQINVYFCTFYKFNSQSWSITNFLAKENIMAYIAKDSKIYHSYEKCLDMQIYILSCISMIILVYNNDVKLN